MTLPFDIRTIISTRNAPGWEGLAPDQKQRNIDALYWLLELASNEGFDISHWDALSFLSDGGPHGWLIWNKPIISKLFYERVAKEKGNIDAQLPILIERARKEIDERFKNVELRHLGQIENEIVSLHNKYDEKMSEAREYHSQIRKLVVVHENIRGKKLSVKDIIEDFIKRVPYLIYDRVDEGKVIMFTRANIILKEKNPAAGLDITVDMGKFEIQIEPIDCYFKVHPHENNTFVYNDEIYHPHISSDGWPCYGSAQRKVDDHLKLGELVEAMQYLWAILNTFTPDNPYCSLVLMRDKQRQEAEEKEKDPQILVPSNAASTCGPFDPITLNYVQQQIVSYQEEILRLDQAIEEERRILSLEERGS